MTSVTLITTDSICRVEVVVGDTRHSSCRFGPNNREHGRALARGVAAAIRVNGPEAALSLLWSAYPYAHYKDPRDEATCGS